MELTLLLILCIPERGGLEQYVIQLVVCPTGRIFVGLCEALWVLP
jgi:hypothetical protein